MQLHPLKSETLNLIHKHIERFCIRMHESPKEIEEFREEMTANIVSSVNSWMSKGYAEAEAVYMALEGFGELTDIEAELTTLYRMKKVFSRNILKASISLLVLGLLIVGWFSVWNEVLQYKTSHKAFNIVRETMGTADNPVSEAMKEELAQMIKSSLSVTGAVIRIQDDPSEAPQKYPLQYKYPDELKLDTLNNIPFKESTFTRVIESSTSITVPGTAKAVNITIGLTLFEDTVFMVGIAFLFGYWVLFAVWASMNVYYRSHGRTVWVIAFLLFNVLGYGLYMLDRSTRRIPPLLAILEA